MRPSIVIVVALIASGPALAQNDLIRGMCRQDGCDEFSIADKQTVATSTFGTLYSTRVKVFHASYNGRKPEGEENGYVLCSSERPAILSEAGGQIVAFLLAPFANRAPREHTNYYALYFGMCHGIEKGRAAARDWMRVARSLDYSAPLKQAKTVVLKGAQDILDPKFVP